MIACATEENVTPVDASANAAQYLPTRQSLQQHPLPGWFAEAKLGILIHWGPSSVPGWAPVTQKPGVQKGDWSEWFAANPYSEWYLNSIQIPGSPSQEHHAATYGEGFRYENFAAQFNEAVQGWSPAAWADLFSQIGARYVVMVAKHHDGFLLWPSAQPNPHREGYSCARDVVGELGTAVRERGMQMGLYYSGGLDWTFNERVIRTVVDLPAAIPQDADYAAYVDGHWRELIERYRPAVLWNDIAYPPAADLHKLLAAYYSLVPEGVVNDRFQQLPSSERVQRLLENPVIRRIASPFFSRLIDWGTSSPKAAATRRRRGEQFDFVTPEYRAWSSAPGVKWECTRAIGSSFGYNRNEGAGTMLTVTELVRLLIDVVSKNGNLLLGVGPAADGTIPELQRERLLGLGRWLAVNGEAIFGAQPWACAAGHTAEGLPVRFTLREDNLYAILLEHPHGQQVTLDVDCPMMSAYLVGDPMLLAWEAGARGIRITLPKDLPDSPAYAIRLRLLASPKKS
jgi:alpha-L-fucosidase